MSDVTKPSQNEENEYRYVYDSASNAHNVYDARDKRTDNLYGEPT